MYISLFYRAIKAILMVEKPLEDVFTLFWGEVKGLRPVDDAFGPRFHPIKL